MRTPAQRVAPSGALLLCAFFKRCFAEDRLSLALWLSILIGRGRAFKPDNVFLHVRLQSTGVCLSIN